MTTRTINNTVTSAVTFGRYSTITVTSLGVVSAPGNGVEDNGVLLNGGLISANYGVIIYGGGSTTNQSGGRILGATSAGGGVLLQGGGDLSNDGVVSGGSGVVLTGGTLSNLAQGTISGITAGVSGHGTVTNAGTITGGSSAGFAVKFVSAGNARVVADPGAVFVGTVNGFNTIGATATSTLEFASGASGGTFSGLGSQYVNFEQVSIDAGGRWTASGANTIEAGQTITEGGFLYSTGQFTNSGVAVGTGFIHQVGGTFVNNGIVSVTGVGSVGLLYVADGGVITNSATARIVGGVPGAVIVDGVVYGTASVPGSTLVNAGYIGGAYALSGGVVTNLAHGTLTGARYGFGGIGATLINAGTVAGASSAGYAVKFVSAGNARVVADPGAVFVGTVNGYNTIGASAVSTLEFARGSSAGTFAGLGSQYVNFAAISVDTGAQWTASGVNTLAANETLDNYGTLFATGTFTNAGTLAGNGVGVGSHALITNAATAHIYGFQEGVIVGGGGSVVNAGLIQGGFDTGAVAYPGGIVTNLAGGTLTGAANGFVGIGATLINAGTVGGASSAGYAVKFVSAGNARVVVDPGAVFIGTVNGFNTIGAAAVSTLEFASGASHGTFSGLGSHYVNFGQISVDAHSEWTASGVNTLAAGQTLIDAGFFGTAGSFTNAGQVTVTTTNAGVADVGGTFANNGSVSGSGLYALGVGAGLITNAATGSILGGVSEGVVAYTGGTVINAGLISSAAVGAVAYGGVAVTNLAGGKILGATYGFSGFGATLINAGTVAAGTPTGDAVKFRSAGNARVVVDPGAVFVGTVNGFNTIGATAISTLEFARGTISGSFSGLGSQYVNFAQMSVDAGANWTASGANTIASGATLTDGGALTFAAAPVGGGLITLAGHGVTLASDGGASIGPSLGGLAGNAVELVGTVEGYASLSGHSLTLRGGTTLSLAGSYTVGQVSVTNNGADTFITACFAGGTEVMTARGPASVEVLCVGERVVTVSGRLAPVVWVGHRLVDLRRHARPFDVMPVRVRAGALGDSVPARDVVLSPDHAVLVDGYLVPVRYLVNGWSIVQEVRETVTYWHVELDRHEAILAEGMACESYLDTGNREAFEGEAAMALHPTFGRDHALAVWERQACAPILFDPAAPALRALHTKLLARVGRLAA